MSSRVPMNACFDKILIVRGAFYQDIYEDAWCRALRFIGREVTIFDSHSYCLPFIFGRLERRFLRGPGIARLKSTLLNYARRERPSVTLLYQGHYFDREFVSELSRWTFVAGYHNDDPFGNRGSLRQYRLLLPALDAYSGFHVYRPVNVAEAFALGVKNVGLLMPYFLPWADFPRDLSLLARRQWEADVVFAGHAENDIRIDSLSSAVLAGYRVKLYGDSSEWGRLLRNSIFDKLHPIYKVVGDDYRSALCGAKIAACFLSKWNRDVYTRRVFEIPACGVFMLAERTDALLELFREGVEAEYFSSAEEFVEKVGFYIRHDGLRSRIAQAGMLKVRSGGHSVIDRMRQWTRDIDDWVS
jgi:spore maturation protein CgeB